MAVISLSFGLTTTDNIEIVDALVRVVLSVVSGLLLRMFVATTLARRSIALFRKALLTVRELPSRNQS